MPKFFYPIIIFLTTIGACQPKENAETPTTVAPVTNALFEKKSPSDTGIDFVNAVQDGEQFNVLTYRNFYNGGGVAIGDINNDGLADVYFTSNMQANKLYLNKGDWQFEDISEKAGIGGQRGWSTGVAMADVNSDGWLDIYVCNSGDIAGDNKENELYINNGDGTFSEKAAAYGLNDSGFSTHASFFDYDMDGDLDCYILNNSYKDPDKIDAFGHTREEKDPMGGDKLFRNDGDHFTNVTEEAGIYTSPIGFGLGVSVSDLNGDMLPDIYISNDFWERDYLYFNKGDGTFSEELTSRIPLCSVASMGSDIADLNNDGTFEVFTTDMLAADNYRLKAMTLFDPYHLEDYKYRADYHYQILQNCLQLNDGQGNFQEVANMSGVASSDWSWGALIFDFDNDGWKDIYVCNALFHEIMYLDFTNFIGDKEEVKKIVTEKGRFDWRDFVAYMPSNPLTNFAYKNETQQPDIPKFSQKAKELGLGEPSFSNGAAYGDLDNDGDMDLVVNNVNMPAFVFQNNSTNNHLKINFEGSAQNPFGLGARVSITANDKQQVAQHYLARGFESSVAPGLIFGLGDATKIDELEVVWPDHARQVLTNVQANQTITLKHRDAKDQFSTTNEKPAPLFQENTANVLKSVPKHTENRYNDFDHERLLPRMLSTQGPCIIKGDVNGDGLEDFLLAGATNDPDKLFLQQGNGWVPAGDNWLALAEADKGQETTCGAIFDLDGDGDKDILLGAGGNEYQKGINNFLLRYYENDGKGNFHKAVAKTPPAAGNFSCILPEDFDGDGDLDLFIGASVVPGNYGLVPRSFLLKNEGAGIYRDISTQEIGALGMVTDAVWSDVDQDKDKDLVVVGDWLPLIIFENQNGEIKLGSKQTFEPYAGWWTAIEAADLDGDGDDDYILGNWGLNSKFTASPERPLSMYVKDFDNNGKTEFILNWYAPADETPYPFAPKMEITAQMPHLKKKNLKFEDYANKTYEGLFSEEERKDALPYRVTHLESCILWTEPSGPRLEALPTQAQAAPLFAIVAEDMDNDGLKDLWLGGNFYALKPQVGRHNSTKGIFLKGDGKGHFEYIHHSRTGLEVPGEIRDAKIFTVGGKSGVLVARNNAEAVFFQKIGGQREL